MRYCWRLTALSMCFLVLTAAPSHANSDLESEPASSHVGEPSRMLNFGLLDYTGGWHELYRYGADHRGIVLYFQTNGCPINRKSFPRLKELRDTFEPKGIKFFIINANPYDDRESIAEEMSDFEVDIPVLQDETQIVALQLGVERTCEAFLVDTSDWSIRYRGALCDTFDYLGQRQHAVNDWLADAMTAMLENKPIQIARTEAKGCLVHLDPMPETVSYVNDIVPILQNKCVPCHSPGNVGPFAFDSHRRVVGWSSMVKEVIMTRRMPPWHADPHFGEFENNQRMTEGELRKLVAWIDAGAPRDGEDDPLVAIRDMGAPKWPLGEPDLVIRLPEPQHIPATGLFDYTYIEIPSGLTEDKWVKGFDVRPSNRAVAHHVLVFTFFPEHLRHLEPRVEGGLGGYFAGYLPGQDPMFFPEGTGQYLPAGTTFQFQMHYNATGKPEVDQTEMALYFHDEMPDRVMAVRSAHTIDFEIQPNDPDSPIEASHWIDRNVVLYGMSPHMHYRGSRVQYEARYPDGTSEILLSVPNYNFDWQLMYQLKEPKHLPAGTVIHASGAWDNSARNPYNPDPNQVVRFGDQTVDEMFVNYMTYAFNPQEEPIERPRRQRPRDEGLRTGVAIDETTIVGGIWQVDVYRFRFEADGLLVVNDAVNGRWSIENGQVHCNVAGRDIEFTIVDDILTNGQDYVFPRIE